MYRNNCQTVVANFSKQLQMALKVWGVSGKHDVWVATELKSPPSTGNSQPGHRSSKYSQTKDRYRHPNLYTKNWDRAKKQWGDGWQHRMKLPKSESNLGAIRSSNHQSIKFLMWWCLTFVINSFEFSLIEESRFSATELIFKAKKSVQTWIITGAR